MMIKFQTTVSIENEIETDLFDTPEMAVAFCEALVQLAILNGSDEEDCEWSVDPIEVDDETIATI